MILKQLKKNLDKSIFDIIIYGSSVKGKDKPNDLDILVIFLEGDLRKRLDKIQIIKNKFKSEKNIDIKQILLKDLYSPSFLAKTGIILEGISVLTGKKFCETLGFNSFTLFWYSLKGLTHTEKVKFNYILAGRTTKGVLNELKAKRLVSGAILVPIEHSLTFEEILKNNNIQYSKKNILQES